MCFYKVVLFSIVLFKTVTHSRYGGIFSDSTITNFLLIVLVSTLVNIFGPSWITRRVYEELMGNKVNEMQQFFWSTDRKVSVWTCAFHIKLDLMCSE